jgi:hypothetical protein
VLQRNFPVRSSGIENDRDRNRKFRGKTRYSNVYNSSMYVGMYVCMYVGMYVCMYVGTYVCMYVCMYVGMYVGIYVCMYVGMYVCM